MSHTQLALRYFDARGRAQFLRAFLRVRGFDYDDERVPLEDDFASWLAVRDDRSLNGPLTRLPVLRVDKELIPEALVIADYLHRSCGDSAALGDRRNRQHEILVSTAYVDIMLMLGTLIWADVLYQGVDLPLLVKSTLNRLDRLLSALDVTVDEWRWVEQMNDRPITIADCLLWEELNQATTIFGPHLNLPDKPALATFRDEHPGRAKFEALLAETPCPITARPGEDGAIATIRGYLDETDSTGSMP